MEPGSRLDERIHQVGTRRVVASTWREIRLSWSEDAESVFAPMRIVEELWFIRLKKPFFRPMMRPSGDNGIQQPQRAGGDNGGASRKSTRGMDAV
jgi:hypothetical protein